MDRFCAASEKPMTPKKQNKTTSTYAAGEADNPIMLAQVKVCCSSLLDRHCSAEMGFAMLRQEYLPIQLRLYAHQASGDLAPLHM